MTAQRSGVTVTPVRSLRQASRIAWRWAATFSRLRERWPRAGAISRPGVWIAYLLLIGLHSNDVVENGVAAARIPNPNVRPRRLLWSAVLAPLCVLVGLFALLEWTPPIRSRAWALVAVVVALVVVAYAAVAFVDIVLAAIQTSNGLRQRRKDLAEQTGREVVIGSMFGAWPQRHGDGGPLLIAALAELRACGIVLLAAARDPGLARLYVNKYGAQPVDPARPLHVAWF